MLPKFTIFQPNGWDNSILPIDVIHKLINEMNNVIDYINNMEDRSVERAKEYTDSQIATVNDSIATTNNNLDQINNSLQASIRSLNQSITVLQSQLSTYGERLNDLSSRENEHYTELRTSIQQVYQTITSVATQLRDYADLKDIYLKNQLEAEINELRIIVNDLLNIKTIDGFTGELKSVREIIGLNILRQSKLRGGNRYALTWGQLSLTDNKGWLSRMTQRYYSRINYFAPTWYNFKLNNFTYPDHVKQYIYSPNLNTWGAFSNLTLLFIGEIVHRVRQWYTSSSPDVKANYQYMDVFDKTEWDAYISDGETIPTIINLTDMNDLYDGTNDYMSLVLTQFKSSVSIFTGVVPGFGIYNATANSANALFTGTGDFQALFQYMLGNLNLSELSDTFTD